ncbi:hypothetical protein HYH03_008828 [Edaphochlamys debaryana]|uniref:Pherophorin domain-containing protein n=1 Tax=Edaphochlamys debaryana TaxID=47281 RepID=A0A835XZK2_9CHLO|nr:hypothetical protein HYH03_008828 [Edaphochlamys debaryana]|eukprot:KAG2492915.1 hypothetical protein HYH03_008828 [Edaphochlamys debaryana]
MPYSLQSNPTVGTGKDGLTEITFTLAPSKNVDYSAARNSWTLMFMVDPLCVGTTPITSEVLLGGKNRTAPHFVTYKAPMTSTYPETECAALKLTGVELTPQQAAVGGTKVLLRFWPSGVCKTLQDFCGGYSGTPNTCVYAFGDNPCDHCPHQMLTI